MDINPKIELEFIKDLGWAEVFEIWRQNEEPRQNWKDYYTSKGFSSWEEWRTEYTEPFRCPEAKWVLYKMIDPVRDIIYVNGGPFRSWKEQLYGEKDSLTFKELADLPESQKRLNAEDFLKNFPKSTTITGMIVGGEIYIIEGMHRCLAMALANQERMKLETEVFIALAESPGGKLPIIGGFKKE